MLDERTTPEEPVHEDVHHERTDVDIRGILWFIVIFVVFMGASYVAVYFHYGFIRSSLRDPELLPVSLVDQDQPKLPPTPRLQPFPSPGQKGAMSPLATGPRGDMRKMREEEERILSTYELGADGKARIPVDRAMELELQRGFPFAAPGETQAAIPLPDQIQPAAPGAASPALAGAAAPPQPRSPETPNP
ncbi:MAG: hypothetical protein ABR517_07680 [Thermoanaerobaculia bacterium]